MTRRFVARTGALLISATASLPTVAADSSAASSGIEEIVVTAQKREESINDVGMAIDAASGDRLKDLGVRDTAELYKVVASFNSNVTYYGTTIYTIRGVGFQDTALASQPTVSVYVDEAPIQFGAMTPGVNLDLERVEALKGPQGTLFGQNSTGGAVNYITNKPTDEFDAGLDVSYGRFNEIDAQAFVSGPMSDELLYRVAVRSLTSSGWQKSYTRDLNLAPDPYWTKAGDVYEFDDHAGNKKLLSGRAQLQWEPNDQLTALLTLSGFIDEGDSQRPQLAGIAPLNPVSALNPLIDNYPLASKNNRSADWGPCVNVVDANPALVTGRSAGFGSVVIGQRDPDGNAENLNNRLYRGCKDAAKDNDMWSGTLRLDYAFDNDMLVTSLTSYNDFNRDQRLESDGTIYQDYESFQRGKIETFSQELRLSGGFNGEGNWVVGANYESTETDDRFLQTYGISSAVPTVVFNRVPLGPTRPNNAQDTDTWAVFANAAYPLGSEFTANAGIRYTNQKRDYRGCGSDGGDGTWADISAEIQQLLQLVNRGKFPPGANFINDLAATTPLDAGPGNCASTGPAPLFLPEPAGFTDELNEDNVSWRVGLDWAYSDDALVYASVSQGFKSGSFPTVASAAFTQLFPARQEELLAYELGAKLRLFDGTMQANVAGWYYDYTDKQILGAVPDPIFGSLPALVNVPDSHVYGFEANIEWYPIEGLRIAPQASYTFSQIDGKFRNFDPFFSGTRNPNTKDFSGEPFPNVPKWTANIDVQYEWDMANGWLAFVGANWNFQSSTRGFFYDRCQEPGISCTRTDAGVRGDSDLAINTRALLDLRAGIEFESWRVFAFGRNVTNKYYWDTMSHVNDVLLRWTGAPATYGVSVSYRLAE